MKILAISGSGRAHRMTHNAIDSILYGCCDEYEIISLSNKKINGCIGCAACAKDNTCKVHDDFLAIATSMKNADIILFGAPNYFGMVNALSHAVLERTFAFTHRDIYALQNKLGIIVSTCENREAINPVSQYIEKMFLYNKIKIIGKMQVQQYNQCYTCGFGHKCAKGAVVRKHGFLEEILPCHLPLEVHTQTKTHEEIQDIRKALRQHGVSFQEIA